MTKQEIIQILREEIARESGIDISEIEPSSDFFSLGLDSISCVYVLDRVEKKLKIELNPLYFWDYPTVEQLSGHIVTLKDNE